MMWLEPSRKTSLSPLLVMLARFLPARPPAYEWLQAIQTKTDKQHAYGIFGLIQHRRGNIKVGDTGWIGMHGRGFRLFMLADFGHVREALGTHVLA